MVKPKIIIVKLITWNRLDDDTPALCNIAMWLHPLQGEGKVASRKSKIIKWSFQLRRAWHFFFIKVVIILKSSLSR